jgi:pre-mRNA-splicing factor SPF27
MDSLPYIDPVNEDYEQYALALIEDELQHVPPATIKHPLLRDKPLQLRSDCLRRSYQRLEQERTQGNGVEDDTTVLDEIAPAVAVPPPIDATTETNVQVWESAVQQARIDWERERIRSIQLQGAKDSAVESWKMYIASVLETQQHGLHQQLDARKQEIEEINHARQRDQSTRYGKQLSILEGQYHGLVQKNYQLKQAIAELQNELGEG